MARDNDRSLAIFEHNSAGGDLDTAVKCFVNERPILVTAVSFIGVNPSDTDGDTTAIDVSYDPNTLDVEIAALAAQEFNDTDEHAQFGTNLARADIALTTASLAANTLGVRVPAGLVVVVTMTNTGAGADTRYFVVVEYIVL